MGLRKAKAKEKPKRTWDSAQCKSKDWDLKSCAYAGCKHGCFQVCSAEALRELKRDGKMQAWGQKTLRAIKVKISWEQTLDSVSLRKEVLKQGFKELQRSKALRNHDREKEAISVVCLQPSVQHTWSQFSVCLSCVFLKSPVASS
jgi:hypothetical protein